MSRSYKKQPIIKDKGDRKYWSRIRSRQNQEVREGKEITNQKEIINDYDYSDYSIRCNKEDCYCMREFGRKKCLDK